MNDLTDLTALAIAFRLVFNPFLSSHRSTTACNTNSDYESKPVRPQIVYTIKDQ